MKRRWPVTLWIGFVCVIAAFALAPALAAFEPLRDFAWPGLVIGLLGIILLLNSVFKIRREPARYRGRILAPVLTVIGLLAIGFFAFGIFYFGRIPSAQGVPAVAEKAPDFTLPDQDEKPVTLADLTSVAGKKGTLLMFYRGHW
jgi:hypothetical protein